MNSYELATWLMRNNKKLLIRNNKKGQYQMNKMERGQYNKDKGLN